MVHELMQEEHFAVKMHHLRALKRDFQNLTGALRIGVPVFGAKNGGADKLWQTGGRRLGLFPSAWLQIEQLRQCLPVLRLAHHVGVVVRAAFYQHEELGLHGGVKQLAPEVGQDQVVLVAMHHQ